MIEASEFIKELIDDIDYSIVGEFNASDGKTYFCNTKWARVGKTIVDSLGDIFIITEVKTDVYIVAVHIDNEAKNLDKLCFLDAPYFKTGTKLATNREWTIADPDLENKLPLVWLLEVISETGYGRGSALDRSIEVKLFFLDETDPSQYYTKEHREQVVKPMQKLMMEFFKVVDKNRMYEAVENYRYKTFSRFGVEQENGVFENILDANLSGVAL